MNRSSGRTLAITVLATLVVAIIAVTLWYAPATRHAIGSVLRSLRGLGDLGPIVFGVLYAIGVVTLIPAAPMTIIGGIAFGPWAFPLVMMSAMVGAMFAFVLSRYVLRDRLKRYLQRGTKLGEVDKAITAEGWKVVALLRLSPLVPFNLQNYLLGATQIKLWPYVVSTFLGIIPGTAVFVYLGAAFGKAALSAKHTGPLQWTLFGVGFVATVAVTYLITKRANERLSRAGLRRK
jgi:uncharacterized membrane protein YdjX (TVP38/TMEM64 family)